MTDIVLDPLRSEAIEAGGAAVLAAWLVSEGDHVVMGQPLCEARVLGQTLAVPAPHAGVVEEIRVAAGERFAPAEVLARVIVF